MTRGTVNWTAPLDPATLADEGLRERKKRLTRQRLTDTATEMFMERGFDAVRVSEIAEACGVSEKTVFNYFPTKESLVLDLPQATTASLRITLADPGLSPVEATLTVLAGELESFTSWLAAQEDLTAAAERFTSFGAMIHSTPSLRAHQRDLHDRLATVVAELLARRAGAGADDPEAQIAATALLGLWPIQFQSLARHLDGTRTPRQVHDAVTADVRRAAELLDAGLRTFGQTNRPLTKNEG